MLKTKKNKIAVITSISGIKNPLVDPEIKFDEADYFAFVSSYQSSNIWIQKKILDFTCDITYSSRRNAKIYKIIPELFLPEYEYYIWIDSTHDLIESPIKIIDTYLKSSDIALFLHRWRNCIYEEAKTVINYELDLEKNVTEQINFYKKMGYPENSGLYENSVVIRRNTKIIKRMNLLWWEQICKYSSRDQISLPYCLDNLKILPTILPGWANTDFKTFEQNKIAPHKRDKNWFV